MFNSLGTIRVTRFASLIDGFPDLMPVKLDAWPNKQIRPEKGLVDCSIGLTDQSGPIFKALHEITISIDFFLIFEFSFPIKWFLPYRSGFTLVFFMFLLSICCGVFYHQLVTVCFSTDLLRCVFPPTCCDG